MTPQPTHPLDLTRCLNEAADVYRKNFLTFLFAALLFDILSIFSLLILTGPLVGGMVVMTLRALTAPDHTAKLGDLFAGFHRFGSLVALFFLSTVLVLAGFLLFVLPGIVLTALWLFPAYLVMDRDLGMLDAMSTSWRIVLRRGFWINFAAAAIILAITAGVSLIPYVGWLIGLFLAPLAWLINSSAYIQEVREQSTPDEFPVRSAFPVVTASVYQPPST